MAPNQKEPIVCPEEERTKVFKKKLERYHTYFIKECQWGHFQWILAIHVCKILIKVNRSNGKGIPQIFFPLVCIGVPSSEMHIQVFKINTQTDNSNNNIY